MGNIVGAGGTTTSFSNTPQARDDTYIFIEDTLLADGRYYNLTTKTVTLDVMSNDLGGNAKSLFSIDDGYGNQIQDLSQTDLLTNSAFSSWQRTEDGNWIRIANGKIEYRLTDPAHPNDPTYARDVNSLSANEEIHDNFTYAIKLGNGTLSWATVHVNFQGAQDQAAISGSANATVVEAGLDASGAALAGNPSASGILSVIDADAGQATFQSVAAASCQGNYGTFTFNASTGEWTYALNNAAGATEALAVGETGHDTLTVWSADGSASQTIDVTIVGTNDRPDVSVAAGDSATPALGESNSALVASGTLTAIDPDTSDTLGLTVSGVSTGGTYSGPVPSLGALYSMLSVTNSVSANVGDANNVAWAFNSGSEAFDFLPAGETLTLLYVVTAADGHGGGDSQTITVTIQGANDAALISGTASGTGYEDGAAASGDLNSSDVDNADDAWTAASGAGVNGYGNWTIGADGQWSYSVDNANPAVDALNAGDTLSDSFTVSTVDGTTQLVTVTIQGANDAALISGTASGTGYEDGAAASGDLNSSDVDNADDAWTAASGAGVNGYGNWTIGADGQWSYSVDNANPAVDALNAGDTLSDSFTVSTVDGTTQLVTVTIQGANDAALISGTASGTGYEDGAAASGDLNSSDVDNADDAWTAASGAGVNGYGNWTIGADGQWSYSVDNANPAVDALNAGDTLSDSFTVSTVDGTTQLVTVTIQGANDAALISGTASGTVTEDAPTNTATGNLNSTDVDNPNDSWTPSSGNSVSGYGTFSVNALGVWVYTLNNLNSTVNALNNGQTLADSFSVATADGTVQVVNIAINGHSDVTVVSPPSAYSGPNADPNDFDNAGPTAGASVTSQSAQGTTTYNGTNNVDTINGGAGTDAMYGHGDDDTLNGQNGQDQSLYGQTGNDTIYGGSGADVAYGGSGNDTIYGYQPPASDMGGDSGDVLYGGSGSDTIFGQGANDIIIGGYGADTLTGGIGADTFSMLSLLDTNDLITDFESGQDNIDLSALDANGALAGNQDFAWGGTTATANGVWYAQSGANTVIYADTDGNAATAEFMITLQNYDSAVAPLQHADFIGTV